MGSSDGSQSPKFAVIGERRPYIRPYSESKFHTGDSVYLLSEGGRSREGPYCIASVASPGVYTLSLESGDDVKDGAEIEERDLEANTGTQ